MKYQNVRQAAVSAVTNYAPIEEPLNFLEKTAKEIFGCNVFNNAVMRERLPKHIFKAVQRTMKTGARLNPEIADAVATAMKDWAISKLLQRAMDQANYNQRSL